MNLIKKTRLCLLFLILWFSSTFILHTSNQAINGLAQIIKINLQSKTVQHFGYNTTHKQSDANLSTTELRLAQQSNT